MNVPKWVSNVFKGQVLNSLTEGEINIMAATRGSGDISGKINNQMLPITRAEVDDWMKALNALRTERPSRLLLNRIYDRILLDDKVTRGIQKRMARVKTSRFKLVDKAKNENPELIEFFKKKWFDEFLEMALMSQFTGVKLIEVNELDENGEIKKLKLINDNHVNPWLEIVVKQVGDEKGWPYKQPPASNYYIEVGDANKPGILAKVAVLVIFKSFAMSCWADYAHKYGVPPRVLKRKGADKKRLKELEDIMKNMLGSNWAIISDQEELAIFEPKNATGSKDVFDGLINRCDNAITGLLVGENGTTETSSTGTYGSLMVMAEVSDDIHEMDLIMLQYLINNELIPRLVEYGYPLMDWTLEWDDFQDLTAMQIIDAVQKLSNNYEFDVDELAKRTGLPIIGLRRLPGESVGGSADGLGKLNARMQALYPGHVHGGTITAAGAVGSGDINRIIREVFDGKVGTDQLDAALSTALGNRLYEGAMQAFDTDNVVWNSPDNLLASKLRDNLYAFSSAKSYAQMREMGALLVDENNQVRSWSDFKREAEKVAEIHNVNYLNTEYRNAIASGQMAAQWNRYQADKDILPFLEYQTAGDRRVRDEHAALDGFVAHIDDAVWDRIYPPNGHGCRCDVTATGDGSGAGRVAPDIDVPPSFQANVGKSGIVYTNQHPYFQVMPQSPTALDAVRNYGMRPASSVLADANKLPKSGKSDFGKHWPENEPRDFADHSKLKLRGNKDVFGESEYAHKAKDVLSKPSEVWTNERSTRYLKYYDDGAALIDTNSQMQLTGWRWFTLDEARLIDTVRNGILLKR